MLTTAASTIRTSPVIILSEKISCMEFVNSKPGIKIMILPILIFATEQPIPIRTPNVASAPIQTDKTVDSCFFQHTVHRSNGTAYDSGYYRIPDISTKKQCKRYRYHSIDHQQKKHIVTFRIPYLFQSPFCFFCCQVFLTNGSGQII